MERIQSSLGKLIKRLPTMPATLGAIWPSLCNAGPGDRKEDLGPSSSHAREERRWLWDPHWPQPLLPSSETPDTAPSTTFLELCSLPLTPLPPTPPGTKVPGCKVPILTGLMFQEGEAVKHRSENQANSRLSVAGLCSPQHPAKSLAAHSPSRGKPASGREAQDRSRETEESGSLVWSNS